MANTIDCLDNIIGVTPLTCDCIDQVLNPEGSEETDPDWYKKSTSGFFIHTLDGVVELNTVKDIVHCENMNEFYKRLIHESIVESDDDVSAGLNARYKKKDSNFVGFLGSKSSGKLLNLTTAYAGMRIETRNQLDGVLVVKGIGVNMGVVAEFNVLIYRRYVETDLYELVDTIEGVSSFANSYKPNPFEEPIILPMHIDSEGDIEYYFLYDNVAALKPRDNRASCGCGSKEHQLSKLISYGGVSGDVLSSFGGWSSSINANGIVLDIEVRCDAEAMICKMYNANLDWKKYMAHAVLYKAAMKIQKKMLSTNTITQEVIANAEIIQGNLNDFEIEYNSRIKYLIQNIDLSVSGCYTCNDKRMKVTQILL